MIISNLQNYIAEKDRQIAELDLQYGDKRPAWVDDQLKTLRFYRDDAQKTLDALTPVGIIMRLVDDAKAAFDELPTPERADFHHFSRGMAILDQIKELAGKLGEVK